MEVYLEKRHIRTNFDMHVFISFDMSVCQSYE